MKSLAVVLLSVFSMSIFSQIQRSGRTSGDTISSQELQGLKVQVLKLADRINTLTGKKIHTMERREINSLKQVLQEAKAILKDSDIFIDPIPQNIVCSQDYDLNLYHQTYSSMDKLARYELSYFSSEAKQFADRWTKKYPCDYAAEYEDKISTLKDFADKKLSFFSSEAKQFALTNVDKLCLDQDYSALFDIHYNFADRQLRYFSSEARKYAFDKIKHQMLSCEVFF